MIPEGNTRLSNAIQWHNEIEQLRIICKETGLKETYKWGKPCYTFQDKNVVLIQGFKEYCALLFFKGYLMDDPEGILQKTGQNTRVGRQIRFSKSSDITEMAPVLKTYIRQATEIQKSGKKGNVIIKEFPPVPAEFKSKLDTFPALNDAFEALTPGRQRAYIYYFAQPSQPATRASRIEKCLPRILQVKGLNERK